MSVPDLSILVAAYNQPDRLHATLRSVLSWTQAISYELLVIDSASPELDAAAITNAFSSVELISLAHNAGFAAANNVGIRRSRGRYVVLLNPDTLLHNDAFTQLVAWLDAHPDVGAVGPQLVQSDGQPQPYSYGVVPGPRYLLQRVWSHVGGRYLHDWQGLEPRDVDWIAGTCLMMRRAAIDSVGLLDEQFFLYWEDVDWGVRARRAGWRVVFVPTVKITHWGGASIGTGAQVHYDRSLVRWYGKHYGGLLAVTVWLGVRSYRLAQRWLRPGRHGDVA